MENSSAFSKWIGRSVTAKLLIIGFLILLLLIPSGMITSLVSERKHLNEEVTGGICSLWGGQQIITGPFVSVPYEKPVKQGDKTETMRGFAHFLPESLNIRCNVTPEIRHRGIYEAVVYRARISLSGIFTRPDISDLDLVPENLHWSQASLVLGIPDLKGVKQDIVFLWGTEKLMAMPGLKNRDLAKTGVTAPVQFNFSDHPEGIPFSVSIDLNGSGMAGFVPMGRITTAEMTSSWKDPSFEGSLLPDEHRIDDSGFTAKWKVLQLNRDFPQQWKDKEFDLYSSATDDITPSVSNGTPRSVFGTRFLIPVDHYQKSTRSVKYAVMFTMLTFLLFFFIEILGKKRFHPVQYFLVGLALMVFYTLLVSLSEQMAFGYAYLIAAVAIVGLIAGYTATVFRSRKLALIMTLVLGFLYVFLYVLLQLQDYALLLGSVGLFTVLAAVMFLSRNIEWYKTEE